MKLGNSIPSNEEHAKLLTLFLYIFWLVYYAQIVEIFTEEVDLILELANVGREESSCRSCGARNPKMSNKCSKCGKTIVRKLVKRDYSSVRHQQGRVATDDDWGEISRVVRKAQKIATVRCASCGAINTTRSTHCKNCGANL